MISYAPFFKTLQEKKISYYYLINKQGFNSNTLRRMKKGMNISTKTIDALCFVLNCEMHEIVCYVKDE